MASPWTRKNLLVTMAITAVGALLWAFGWFRVSGEPTPDEQMASMNFVIAGLVVIGIAYALWFLAGRRAVGIRRRLLLTPAATIHAGSVQSSPDEVDRYVGAERLFHRPQCPMAADRGWTAVDKDEHLRSGRVACGVCAP